MIDDNETKSEDDVVVKDHHDHENESLVVTNVLHHDYENESFVANVYHQLNEKKIVLVDMHHDHENVSVVMDPDHDHVSESGVAASTRHKNSGLPLIQACNPERSYSAQGIKCWSITQSPEFPLTVRGSAVSLVYASSVIVCFE
uniref:Uncharacterized protein n=1 Tax=Peronospora matthiolae TaxID=2874970 RepID=A0AAV1UM88_9STRA